MTKQKIHRRISKKGKPFIAGSRKPVKRLPKPAGSTITINKLMPFRKIISATASLFDEVKVSTVDNALMFVRMDPANVAIAKYDIPNSDMLKRHKSVSFTLSLQTLRNELRKLNHKLPASIKIMPTEMILQQPPNTISIPQIELEDREVKMPDELKFTATYTVMPAELKQAIKMASTDKYGSVTFSAKPGGIAWSSGKKDSPGATGKISGTGSGDAKAKYSVEYLTKLCADAEIFDKAKIEFGTDYPIKLTFTGEYATKVAILAPRVENDD